MSVGYLKKCTSNGKPKKRHPTPESAEGQRTSMIASGKWTAQKSNVYYCNQCACWHAGHVTAAYQGRRSKKTQRRKVNYTQ